MTEATVPAAAPPIHSRYWRDNRILRLLIVFFTVMLIYAGTQAVRFLAVKTLPSYNTGAIAPIVAGIGIVVSLWAYVWLVHRLERHRPVTELRPAAALPGLFAGFVLGAAIISAVIGAMVLMGLATISLATPPTLPVSIIAAAALSGVCEELVFRGALFRITEEMFGTLVALVISAAFFGGAHIANPHASWVSSTAIAIEAGLMLGFAYTATRSMWFPIGLHAAWNLTEGGVYSTSVSGAKVVHGIFTTSMKGPDILTGGAFGPEASVVAVGVCSLLTLILAVITFRRGEWKLLHLQIRATTRAESLGA